MDPRIKLLLHSIRSGAWCGNLIRIEVYFKTLMSSWGPDSGLVIKEMKMASNPQGTSHPILISPWAYLQVQPPKTWLCTLLSICIQHKTSLNLMKSKCTTLTCYHHQPFEVLLTLTFGASGPIPPLPALSLISNLHFCVMPFMCKTAWHDMTLKSKWILCTIKSFFLVYIYTFFFLSYFLSSKSELMGLPQIGWRTGC